MIELNDYELERLVGLASDAVHTSHGQLTPLDRLVYFWGAYEFFTGAGTIVDAGALVGGSTCVIGEGLLANLKVQAANPTLHVYDLFEDDRDGYSANLLKGWYNQADDRSQPYDFQRHFLRNTRKYEHFIKLHKGDITKSTYADLRGIEVLSIDVAKNADLMLFCAKQFFPHLIPGQSIILHQDYIYAYQPWLHVAMELMADIVEKIYDVPTQCTSVFAAKRPITEADVEMRLGKTGADYYHVGNARCLYAAIEKARPGFGKFIHTAALSYFFATMGQRKTAIQVALRMLDEHDPSVGLIERGGLGSFLQNDLGIDYKALCR